MVGKTFVNIPCQSCDVRCGPAGSGWVEITAVIGTKLIIFKCGTKNCDLAKEAFLYQNRQIE